MSAKFISLLIIITLSFPAGLSAKVNQRELTGGDAMMPGQARGIDRASGTAAPDLDQPAGRSGPGIDKPGDIVQGMEPGIEDTQSSGKVPFLHRIPLLGRLFRGEKNDKPETVVIVKPQIVHSAEDN